MATAKKFFIWLAILGLISGDDVTGGSSLRKRDDVTALKRLRKCCSSNQVFDAQMRVCVEEKDAKTSAQDWKETETPAPALLPDIMLSLGDGDGPERKIIPFDFGQFDLADRGLIRCPGDRFKMLDMSDEFQYLITNRGDLVSIGGDYQTSFQIGDFCLDLATSSGPDGGLVRMALTCDPCHEDRICIKACCPFFQMAEPKAGSFECRNLPESIHPLNVPTWRPDIVRQRRDFVLVNDKNFGCEKTRQNPKGRTMPTPPGATLRFLDDGSVEMEQSGQKENYFPANFCVNFLQLSANEQLLRNETFFICPKDQDEETCIICQLMYPISITVSTVFLLITFVVFAILPDLRKSLLGQILHIFILALFSANLSLTVTSFGGFGLTENKTGCNILAFLVQFMFLHCFTWLPILSYAVFKTSTTTWTKLEERRNRRTFVSVAIAVPTSIVAATFLVTFAPDESGSLEILRPNFGLRNCFFDHAKQISKIVFFHFPISMMLLTSTYFFLLTMSQSWNQRVVDPPRTGFRKRIWTAIKVCSIVGINWILEFSNFVLEWLNRDQQDNPFAYVGVAFNLLQGVLLFAVLVLDKSVLQRLGEKIFGNEEVENRTERSNSRTPFDVRSN